MSSWTINGACVTGMAQRLARGAHNSEVTRSKRVAGIYHTSHRCIKALEHLRNPLSSEAERRTHNPEVGGSKPPGGIHFTSCSLQKHITPLHEEVFSELRSLTSSWTLNGACVTGVAQRQRAWLITTRTYDRNVSPVSITHRIGASRHWSTYETPLAQRQSAVSLCRLITPRSADQNPQEVSISLRVLYRST